MHPGFIAATLGHGRTARKLLEFISGGVVFPLFPEGDEAAGGKDSPGAWQGGE
jgi:hypothetical protein